MLPSKSSLTTSTATAPTTLLTMKETIVEEAKCSSAEMPKAFTMTVARVVVPHEATPRTVPAIAAALRMGWMIIMTLWPVVLLPHSSFVRETYLWKELMGCARKRPADLAVHCHQRSSK